MCSAVCDHRDLTLNNMPIFRRFSLKNVFRSRYPVEFPSGIGYDSPFLRSKIPHSLNMIRFFHEGEPLANDALLPRRPAAKLLCLAQKEPTQRAITSEF